MFCLDEYLERIHYIPQEIGRNLRLIQELDRRATCARDFLKIYQDELMSNLALTGNLPSSTGTSSTGTSSSKKPIVFTETQREIIARIDKAQTEYFHLSDEKCKIAEQIYDEIAFQHNELCNEAKRFCGENNIKPPPTAPNEGLGGGGNNGRGGAAASLTTDDANGATKNSSLQGSTAGNASGSVPPIKKKKKVKKLEEKAANRQSNMTNERSTGQGNHSPARLSDSQVSLQNNPLHLSSFAPGGASEYSHNSSHILQHIPVADPPNKQSKRQTKSKYATSNRTSNHCGHCGQETQGDTVQCDRCEGWIHYICANLTEDTIPQFWYCRKCTQIQQQQQQQAINMASTIGERHAVGH